MKRQHFERQVKKIYTRVQKMGSMVEEALHNALTAVSSHDSSLADSVLENDKAIDALQHKIDDRCIKLIATEQPVATDLRELLMTMKISSALERIGDHACYLVRNRKVLTDDIFHNILPHIREMTKKGISMIHDSLKAYIDQDFEAARTVARRDDEIDALHRALYTKLITIMKENPTIAEQTTGVLFLNRFLERLGDHATHICEWIVYAKTGEREIL